MEERRVRNKQQLQYPIQMTNRESLNFVFLFFNCVKPDIHCYFSLWGLHTIVRQWLFALSPRSVAIAHHPGRSPPLCRVLWQATSAQRASVRAFQGQGGQPQ